MPSTGEDCSFFLRVLVLLDFASRRTKGSKASFLNAGALGVAGRTEAKKQLSEDIPRLLTDFGDAVGVGEFYGSIYNMTPAHMDDVHAAIIDNPDLEVITDSGGERRKANTIGPGDTLRMKRQRSFFPLFLDGDQSRKKK
jgi:hypothetical protein